MKKVILFIAIAAFTGRMNAQDLTGKVVFSHFATADNDSIFALNNDGQTLTFITTGERPRVSHNGKLMAFSRGSVQSNPSYGISLYLRDLVAQHDTLIFMQNDYLDYYDFLPGDSVIIYGQECSIYTVNIDGTDAFTNTCSCDCYADDPNIRLSDTLVVHHNVNSGLYQKPFADFNDQIIPNTTAGDLYAAFSPDGQYIAYERSYASGIYVPHDLYKIKYNGSDTTRLSRFSMADTIAADPVWASDMQSIFIIARVNDTLGIYQVQADGSGAYRRIHLFGVQGGSPLDYWMGLADSISSSNVVVNACDSIASSYSFANTGGLQYQFSDSSIVHGGTIISRHWDFGDVSGVDDTSSSANPTHTFSIGGNFNVCLSITGEVAGQSCTDSGCAELAITSTGISNLGQDYINIYPNPSKGNFTIHSNIPVITIAIYDALGRKTEEQKLNGTVMQMPAGLQNGIYFIHFMTSEGTIVKKLVLQR